MYLPGVSQRFLSSSALETSRFQLLDSSGNIRPAVLGGEERSRAKRPQPLVVVVSLFLCKVPILVFVVGVSFSHLVGLYVFFASFNQWATRFGAVKMTLGP